MDSYLELHKNVIMRLSYVTPALIYLSKGKNTCYIELVRAMVSVFILIGRTVGQMPPSPETLPWAT